MTSGKLEISASNADSSASPWTLRRIRTKAVTDNPTAFGLTNAK